MMASLADRDPPPDHITMVPLPPIKENTNELIVAHPGIILTLVQIVTQPGTQLAVEIPVAKLSPALIDNRC